ncbi:MAG: hypothetical protein COV69_03590, partial [Parcubacteria group bacterium CG11_big_fil_rev_8_21_14_0_20_39_14]
MSKKSIFIGLFSITLLTLVLGGASVLKAQTETERKVGGQCSYASTKGNCAITSIQDESVINFKFTPT